MAKFLFYDDKIINILLEDEKPSGGAAVQAYGWIMGLLASGHEVCVLSDPSKINLVKDDCRDITILPDFERAKGIRWLRWLYYRLPYIYNTLKETKPDYVYKGIPAWDSFMVALICRKLKIRFLQRISNDFLLDSRFFRSHSAAHRYFQNLGFKLSDCILCQNDYQLSIVSKRFPDNKVFKISNPIFINHAPDSDEVLGKDFIAWIGLFQYQKNLKLLFEIASLLQNEQFVVAGKEIPKIDEETLLYLSKLRDLPNVRFVGFLQRQEVLPFLSQAKYLLNTSHYEGFSNTFLEAMAVGTPILTSDKVNPDSIISENNLGMVYTDARNLESRLLSTDQEAYKRMSYNALHHVMRWHDYKSLTTDLLNFLNISQPSKVLV